MQTPGGPKGAGQKRKRGQKRKSRDEKLFPYFYTINRQELQQYHDCEGGGVKMMEIRWMNSDVNRPSGIDEGRRRR